MKARAFRCIFAILSFVQPIIAHASGRAIAIRDVTIIDCSGRAPQPGMTVLIADGRIARIEPVSKLKLSAHTKVIDGHGRYLIPGLWNMHVHLGDYANGKVLLASYLAQGITGVRDMGSPLDDVLRLRSDTRNGTIRGPRMVVAGPILQGPLPFQMPMFITASDTAAAREKVQMLYSRGVDFIKVQDAIPHEIYIAVADEARREKLHFAGHVPPTVLADEASELGQRSIEHLGGRFWGVLVASSDQEAELHSEEVQMYHDILYALNQKQPPPDPNMHAAFTRKALQNYDLEKARSLIARFRKNDTWQCPTLVALHSLWDEGQFTAEDLSWAQKIVEKDAELVRLMQEAGVGILTGTDLPPNAEHGTIQDEFIDLVDAGLSPLQALQTATRNPAEFLGELSQSGTVEVGKVADLVLLAANPLDDVRNTKKISLVLLHGEVIPQ